MGISRTRTSLPAIHINETLKRSDPDQIGIRIENRFKYGPGCNTPVLHPPIKTCHISFFYLDSHFKINSPTHNNYSKKLHLLLKKSRSGNDSTTDSERERERETEEEEQRRKREEIEFRGERDRRRLTGVGDIGVAAFALSLSLFVFFFGFSFSLSVSPSLGFYLFIFIK